MKLIDEFLQLIELFISRRGRLEQRGDERQATPAEDALEEPSDDLPVCRPRLARGGVDERFAALALSFDDEVFAFETFEQRDDRGVRHRAERFQSLPDGRGVRLTLQVQVSENFQLRFRKRVFRRRVESRT